jgi:hypothetical protein
MPTATADAGAAGAFDLMLPQLLMVRAHCTSVLPAHPKVSPNRNIIATPVIIAS